MNTDTNTAEVLHNHPIVKQESCVMHYKCANCMAVCQAKAIRAVPCHSSSCADRLNSKKTAFIEPELCTRCGLCYQVCPTNAIEDLNAIDYRIKALEAAGKDMLIVFSCEHNVGQTFRACPELDLGSASSKAKALPYAELVSVPDISIVSWRDIFKIISMGSPVLMIGCNECRQTNHFKQIEEIFANSCYEGAFRFFERGEENPPVSPFEKGGQGGFKEVSPDENILEQIITSYTGKIPFPGTAWVDIGDRCTLCQNCANVCPTSALSVRKNPPSPPFTKGGMGGLSLMYDHNLCKGCPVCEKACPERCIAIDRRLRLNKLSAIDVKCKSNMLFCKGCDKPIAADAAFERIKNILTAHGQTTEQLEYCPDCKSTGVRFNAHELETKEDMDRVF